MSQVLRCANGHEWEAPDTTAAGSAPLPCPVCGHAPPKVTHRWTGRDSYGLRHGTHPEAACPRCRRACVAPEAMPGAYGAFLRPWSALQVLGQWNAGRVRRAGRAQPSHPQSWAIRAEDFDRLADDGEDLSRYLDWRRARRRVPQLRIRAGR